MRYGEPDNVYLIGAFFLSVLAVALILTFFSVVYYGATLTAFCNRFHTIYLFFLFYFLNVMCVNGKFVIWDSSY